jgi:alkanesulfonate monooxygenase SsuD/methylene tetrahydromethanopterin reductase-like flavin-dependent oxidoreductase (luciferase family)
VLTAVDEDPERARRAAAEHVAYYLRDIPGYYDCAAVEAGFEDIVEAVRAASSTDAGAEHVADELLDHLAVVGTPEAARAQLDDLRAAGLDLPIVRAPAGTDQEWIDRTLRTFAPR